jgi:hypothetical protein
MAKLAVHAIASKGDLDKECVWLKVTDDIPNLSFYMLSDTTYNDNDTISNELRHMYWFRKMAVKKGDWVQLMTKAGKNTSAANDQKTTTHMFFWGLGRTVWNKDGDCAVLFELNGWNATKV